MRYAHYARLAHYDVYGESLYSALYSCIHSCQHLEISCILRATVIFQFTHNEDIYI